MPFLAGAGVRKAEPQNAASSAAEARAEHDRVLSGLVQPRCIVANSLLDDRWQLASDDETIKRGATTSIDFDAVILPGGIRLNDPGNERDLLTAKIFVARGVMNGLGWSSSGLAMKQEYRALLTLMRWRHASGLDRFSDLTEGHFLRFQNDLRRGGAGELLPLRERLIALMEAVGRGDAGFSTYRYGRLDWNEIAHQLGVSNAKALPRELQAMLYDYVAACHPELSEAMLRESRRSEASEDEPPSAALDRSGGEAALTDRRIAVLLAPWERLWTLRRFMPHDPIGVRAFDHLRTRWSVSAQLGRDVGRTRDIPPDFFAHLLDAALRWVLVYGDAICTWLEICDGSLTAEDPDATPGGAEEHRTAALQAAISEFPYKDEGSAPWPVLPRYSRSWLGRGQRLPKEVEDVPDVRSVSYRLLPAACYIVIATFSMPRAGEVLSLPDGCVDRDDDGAWVSRYVEKTYRNLRRFPAPESVVQAVRVLERLSAPARKATGHAWLFQFREAVGNGRIFSFDVNGAINEFAAFIEAPRTPDGLMHRLSSHQFRRAGCVIYVYRFRIGKLMALSQHLGHLNSHRTERYVEQLVHGSYQALVEEQTAEAETAAGLMASNREDAERHMEDMEFATKLFMTDVFKRVALGDERMAGFGGSVLSIELSALVAEADRRISLGKANSREETLDRLMVAFVRRRSLVAHPDGHSYCKCTSAQLDLDVAECLRRKRARAAPGAVAGDTRPDMAFAEAAACAVCPHNVQLGENEGYWVEAVSRFGDVAENATGFALRESAARRRDLFKAHHQRCFAASPEPDDQQE